SDNYALSAIKLLFSNLERAVEHADDIEARSAVMLGATYAGLAFGSGGTGAAHAIQYPVGAQTHTAHGLGVGILLPHTMDFNLQDAAADYAEIARAIGVASNRESNEVAARAAIASIRALFSRIGIPSTLRDIAITEDHLDSLSARSMNAARLIENNPTRLNPAAVKQILTRALQGA
ncbi:iron-containing alcohol dehydrogenase, partial [Mesorhizobium sp. M7A.T.Ca.TU.009.01.3.2]